MSRAVYPEYGFLEQNSRFFQIWNTRLFTCGILLYNGGMKTKLTLQEKLRDLRDERKLTLAELSNETGIPTTTLNRLENDEGAHIGYQDVFTLARYYGVSTDYLFDLTDNRQYRNIEIDKLHLSDEAVAELISGKLNNRLLSEVIAHPDFAELLAGLEVFVDRTISENMEIVNKAYKVSIDKLTIKKVPEEQRDEYIASLKEASIDPDDYLRFRLSKRFEKMAQDIYSKREKTALSAEGQGFLNRLVTQIEKFNAVDLKKTSQDERKSMLDFLSKSKVVRWFTRRKFGK